MSALTPVCNDEFDLQPGEHFTNEDENTLVRLSNDFKGFKVKSQYLTNLFPGKADAEGYKLPIAIINNEQRTLMWPDDTCYLDNPNKRKSYFFPTFSVLKVYLHCSQSVA